MSPKFIDLRFEARGKMGTAVTLETVLVRRSDHASATIDDVTAIMDPEKDVYFLIDAVGSDIWNRIAHPTSLQEICSELLASYDVDLETCQKDVLAFASDMVARGLAVAA
jgi:hypothetical protein